MLDSLLFSLNIVLPIFILIILGWCATRLKLVTHEFMDKLGDLCFRFFVSAQIFQDIYQSEANFREARFLILYGTAVTVIGFLAAWPLARAAVRVRESRGAFIQSCFRGSFTILGQAMVRNLYGEAGAGYSAALLTAIVIAYNIMAVICLSPPGEKGDGWFRTLRRIMIGTAKNPLIIAVVLAIILRLLRIDLPYLITKPVSYFAACATPVALLCVGAGLTVTGLKSGISSAVLSSFFKTVVHAAIAIPVAILLGFRGWDLGIMAILFTAPNPAASYVMAASMDGDRELAAAGILISTVMSVFACTLAIFLLKHFSLL